MRNLYHTIRADIFKLLHTNLVLLHLLVPALGILLFCGYYSYSPWSERQKLYGYAQAVAIVFPLMISVGVSMLYEMELKAGNFQTILSVPCSKAVSHAGNLAALCLLGLFASIFAVFGFGIVFRFLGFVKFSLPFYFRLSIILFLSNLALYVLQYGVCFMAGRGISLSFGIIGTLISPLFYLSLGDYIWKYIPYGYGIRTATYYCYRYADSGTYKTIAQDFRTGVITAGIITVILSIVFIIGSSRWEGRNVRQE